MRGFLTSPSARATCSRHSAPGSRASLENLPQRLFRGGDVGRLAGAREGGRGHDCQRGIVPVRRTAASRRSRACPRSAASAETAAMPNGAVRILQRVLDARQPAIGQRRSGRPRPPAAPARGLRRVVRKQQRGDEAPLVHRLQQVDRVEHVPRFRMASSLTSVSIDDGSGSFNANRRRLDDLLLDAAAERAQVLAARRQRRRRSRSPTIVRLA